MLTKCLICGLYHRNTLSFVQTSRKLYSQNFYIFSENFKQELNSVCGEQITRVVLSCLMAPLTSLFNLICRSLFLSIENRRVETAQLSHRVRSCQQQWRVITISLGIWKNWSDKISFFFREPSEPLGLKIISFTSMRFLRWLRELTRCSGDMSVDDVGDIR